MASTQTGKEGAVSAAVESLRKAMVAGDKAALDKVAMAELSYGHSSGRLENKAEFIATLVSGDAGFTAIELSDQSVNIVDKVALVRHVFNGTRRKDGTKMKLSILTVWMQQQDEWKLLARQAAKL
jgi:ketosteroid isomerase-like protein